MVRIYVSLLTAAAIASTSLAATAQDSASASASATVTLKAGQQLRDANGRRLGAIESVEDGNARVIIDMHLYRIPVSTITQGEKGLQTSLTRSELR